MPGVDQKQDFSKKIFLRMWYPDKHSLVLKNIDLHRQGGVENELTNDGRFRTTIHMVSSLTELSSKKTILFHGLKHPPGYENGNLRGM